MSDFVRRIDGVNYIDAERLWASIKDVPTPQRLQVFMKNAGVTFFDEEGRYVNQPMVGISGIGGFPVSFDDSVPQGQIRLGLGMGTPAQFLEQQQKMRGFAGLITTMNSGNKTPAEMDQLTTKLGHNSKLKTNPVNMMFIGYPKVLEENFRRLSPYALHEGIVTAARTAAQIDPPIAVSSPEGFSAAQIADRHMQAAKAEIAASGFSVDMLKGDAKLDRHEELNGLNIGNAATVNMLDMDLGNLRGTMRDISDTGQELAWRRLMALMNDQMHQLFPDHFKHSSEYGYEMPSHWQIHQEWAEKAAQAKREAFRMKVGKQI